MMLIAQINQSNGRQYEAWETWVGRTRMHT